MRVESANYNDRDDGDSNAFKNKHEAGRHSDVAVCQRSRAAYGKNGEQDRRDRWQA